jgi:hypothetical protein
MIPFKFHYCSQLHLSHGGREQNVASYQDMYTLISSGMIENKFCWLNFFFLKDHQYVAGMSVQKEEQQCGGV